MGARIQSQDSPDELFKYKLVCIMNCEEAQQICTKNQYKEAAWREKLGLLMHLLICRTCGAFSKKNARLTQLCDQASLHSLSKSDKERLKKVIQRQE